MSPLVHWPQNIIKGLCRFRRSSRDARRPGRHVIHADGGVRSYSTGCRGGARTRGFWGLLLVMMYHVLTVTQCHGPVRPAPGDKGTEGEGPCQHDNGFLGQDSLAIGTSIPLRDGMSKFLARRQGFCTRFPSVARVLHVRRPPPQQSARHEYRCSRNPWP